MKNFNPQTTMWTNQKIEDVAKCDITKINPNQVKDGETIQNPYALPGMKLNEWAYPEFIWTHFYPIGNGRMAAMAAGGIDKEIVQINEDTCWDGSPYGTLNDENGNILTTVEGTRNASRITTVNQTGGSKKDGYKYFRGTDKDGNLAPIGDENAIVGDSAFQKAFPHLKSLSNQALNIDNSATPEAVQSRFTMERMIEEKFLGKPHRQRTYKSFVEVYLDWGHENKKAQNYTKHLDLETGMITVEYDYEGHHFRREYLASYPDNVIALHMEADCDFKMKSQLHTFHNKEGFYSFEKISDNEIKVRAAITDANVDNGNVATVNAINFEARMLVSGEGSFTVSDDNSTVTFEGGKCADIYIAGATNYVDYLNLDNKKPSADCEKYMDCVKHSTYAEIRARHIADFTSLFNRTSFTLENADDADFSDIPTEKRVREDVNGKSGFNIGASSSTEDAHKSGVYSTVSKGDNSLAVLEFNMGKYMLISGSREGSQPLNLTGKWNAAMAPLWNGKYTININTEMNYWLSQPLDLAECEKPFIDSIEELAQSGSITARNQYGIFNSRHDDNYIPGDPWVMHHNFDLWRGTQPIDIATAGQWPTGGIWLLEHAWQYFLFNRDTKYLKKLYPCMLGAARFFVEFLVRDTKTGYLITAASCSPEQGGVQPGPAMDTQLIRNLYDMVRRAGKVLGDEDSELLRKIDEQMPSQYFGNEQGKIAPNLIDSDGIIEEWARGDVTFDIGKSGDTKWTVENPFTGEVKDVYFHEASNHTPHKHCSHLWELYPGTHLNPYSQDKNEQELFEAFKKSLDIRGTGSTGWSLAWRMCLHARALNGKRAGEMLEQLLTTRTSPNMFDQHPHFQSDGNFGATAGITEMLIQSHNGFIALLPALAPSWHSGSFTNFKARGNVSVSAEWENARLTKAVLIPAYDGELCVVIDGIENVTVTDSAGNAIAHRIENGILAFNAIANEEYIIK